ncbi:MAG: 2-phosphosulfolactate phosphatase [Synergistaceae bacterium]|jgi:2-phosphosulfolactate phosphatase|nr:2-phosphosulfolactate phosphatase [Synergistaceae bacterium]
MSKPVQVEVILSLSEYLPVVDVWLIVDILRASTMMVSWFAAGGGDLYPTASVEDARRLAASLKEEGKEPLLMGEQNAIAPQGFDLGNSPLSITPELVQNASCAVMATTNGTKAMLKAASTGTPVLVACARNAFAVLDAALSKGYRIGIFCSGRKGRPSWDDTLCAGLLVAYLTEHFPDTRLADGARLAHLAWRGSKDFKSSLKTADHAIFLEKVGYGGDVAFAAEIDAVRVVPELHELLAEKENGKENEKEMRAVLRLAPSTEKSFVLDDRPLPSPSGLDTGTTSFGVFADPERDRTQSPVSAVWREELGVGEVFFAGETYRKQRKNRARRT